MELNAYIGQLKRLTKTLDGSVRRDILSSPIILRNTKTRLHGRGLDGDLNKIGDYSDTTVGIKKSKGQQHGFVTLFDSGLWSSNLFLEWDKSELFLSNKMGNLTQKLIEGGGQGQNPPYGDSIMELDEQAQFWVDLISEEWVRKRLEKLNGKNLEPKT